MFHTGAYFKSTDRAATQSDTTALQGTADTVQNGHIMPNFSGWLYGGWFGGISLSRVQMDSPTIRQLSVLDLWPWERAAIPAEPGNIVDYRPRGRRITAGEELRLLLSGNGVTGTNENWTGVIFYGDGNFDVGPVGDFTMLQATGTTTLVANAWTNVPLTFSESLAAGIWQIIGFEAFSAGAIAARLVVPGQWNRPGCVCGNTNLGIFPTDLFMQGRFGAYGQFSNSAMPSVEFLSNSADTAETVWLKLKKIG